jgi:hypothetical protein
MSGLSIKGKHLLLAGVIHISSYDFLSAISKIVEVLM